jgi:type VI secretion system protein VasJ
MPFENPEIINLGVEPISANAPAGESVRDDTRFEQLSAEIAKIESMTTTVIDWSTALQLSSALLKTKSKDYRVGSYLVFSLYQLKGLEGLFNGLRMLEGLIRNFWDTGFPEKTRMRGRIGAFSWLNDRFAAALGRNLPKPVSDDLILALEKAAQECLALLDEKLRDEGAGDQAPHFSEIMAEIAGRANDVRARQMEAERSKEEAVRKAEAVAAGAILDTADADRIIDECREKLQRVADYYYETSPAEPMSYLIRRGISWGLLAGLPIHENGITYVPPPSAADRQRSEELAGQGEWLALLGETESNFLTQAFVFSQQRQCVIALDHLGADYQGVKDAVISALASLIRRLPEILTLKFNDGTPFVDPPTRSWIEKEVRGAAPSGGAGTGSAEGSKTEEEIGGAANEARRLAAAGKLQDAVGVFRKGIEQASRMRPRFMWKLQLAKLCIELGKPHLALPQLASLDEDVNRYGLQEWEPELSLDVVRQLFLCRQKLAADLQEKPPDLQRQLEELYHRLCRLDVGAASAIEF